MRKFIALTLMISLTIVGIIFGDIAFLSVASAQEVPKQAAPTAQTLDDLLERVKQGAYQENQENKRREREFSAQKSTQQTRLAEVKNTQKEEERRAAVLEAAFKANEEKTLTLQDSLSVELGSLKTLFGVLQQVSGDTKAIFKDSIISAEFPGREAYLDLLIEKASGSELPSIAEISRLWYEMQREMTEQGKIVRFTAEVQSPDGRIEHKEIVRVGTFNLISDGAYLEWRPKYQNISILPRQPRGRFLDSAQGLQDAKEGMVPFALDISRGAILGLLIENPNILERIEQGGIIGYIIIYGLGPLSLLLIGFSGYKLLITRARVKAQIQAQIHGHTIRTDNPLGRILSIYERNKNIDVETLELKLDEAILKEIPALERFLTMIKVIAAIAPLMGLLGTVTGMINTFQSMTLFGTGDPKLMAGGISQALVTTVLGIVVALPTLFLQALIAGWSRDIIHILEEQSAGIIAFHAERGNAELDHTEQGQEGT